MSGGNSKVYIAGPLFSKAEKKFNEEIDRYLSRMKFQTFLPQRDGYEIASYLEKITSSENNLEDMVTEIFKNKEKWVDEFGDEIAPYLEKITSSENNLEDIAKRRDSIQRFYQLLTFLKDTKEIRKCDILIIVLDGRVPDEGACLELGYAFALGKKCVGLKTDSRALHYGLDNPMIMGCIKNTVANSIEDLENVLFSTQS
jgi:nucleoside 2-deoxyribosyltransferase